MYDNYLTFEGNIYFYIDVFPNLVTSIDPWEVKTTKKKKNGAMLLFPKRVHTRICSIQTSQNSGNMKVYFNFKL